MSGIVLGIALWAMPVLLVDAGRVQAQGGERMPSEVLHDVAKGRLQNLQATPTQVEASLNPLLARARTTDLEAGEEVALGLSYFFAFDAVHAKPLFEKHSGRDDLLGRVSWQALQAITFNRDKDFALGERRTGEFRKKFRPIPADLEYTFRMVRNLARQSADAGDHRRVAQMILEDLGTIPAELPFMSFDNLGMYFDSFRKVGRDAEALVLMKLHRDAMRSRATSLPTFPPGADTLTFTSSTGLGHRPGVLHLFPFQDGLFEDEIAFSRDRATALATKRAIDRYTRWIAAAESGQPIPPQ